MKKLKKLLCTLLVVIACLTSAPLQGIAETDWSITNLFSVNSYAASDSGSCGKNAKWKYDSKTKTLTIYGKGEMEDYDPYYYKEAPYSDKEKMIIKNVLVKDGITRIGSYAFAYLYDDSDVETVKIADSVKSIGENAFSGAKIKEITFPKNLKKIEGGAFSDCCNLKKVVIPDTVTVVGEDAFYNCKSLKKITFGNGVKEVPYMFSGCDNLTEVIFGKNVKSFKYDYMNEGNAMCRITVKKGNKYLSSDKNGVLYNKDKTKVLFYPGKLNLKTYTLPETVVAVAKYAFYDVENLEKLNATSVEVIGDYAFAYSDIKEIVLGKKLKTIKNSSFESCEDLGKINLPATVEKIGKHAFVNSAFVTVDGANKKYSSDEHGALFNKDKTILYSYPLNNEETKYDIPETVVKISEYAFYDNKKLENVTFPKNLQKIEAYAFSGCDYIESIYLYKKVDYIGESAFSSCDYVNKLTIEEGSKAQICESAFCYCRNLKEISISSEIYIVGRYAFDSNAYEEELESKKFKGAYYIGNVLCGVIGNPETVKIKEGTLGIADGAFSYETVESVTIPASVKYIGLDAFMCTENLKKITLDKNNQYFVMENDTLFNKEKTRLIKYTSDGSEKKYIAPKGVKYVDNYAFLTDKDLEEIDLGDSLEYVNMSVFAGTKAIDNLPEDKIIYYKNHAVAFFDSKNYSNVLTVKDGTKSVSIFEFCEFPCEAIYIPKSVKVIRSLPYNVYYEGSKEEWEKIDFGEYAEYFIDDLNVHYNFDKNNHKHTYYIGTRYPDKCFTNILITYTCPCGHSYSEKSKTKSYHYYSGEINVTKKATVKNDGVLYNVCESCGKNFDKYTIAKIASVKLSYKDTKYNGKVKTPKVIVTDSNGYELTEGTDYTVKYQSGRKEVGTYNVKVTFKGFYSGSKTLKFNIVSA